MSRKISIAGDKEGELIIYSSKGDGKKGSGSPFLEGEVKLIDSLSELLKNLIKMNENQKRLKYIANHDRLTGLYNHNYFNEEMKRLNYSEQLPISIYLLDINGLQILNESLGYKSDDRILEAVADKLNSAVRRKDIVARWGEDEFAVLMPRTAGEEAKIVKNRAENSCENIIEQDMKISISGGLATKYKPETDLHDVLNEALEKLDQKLGEKSGLSDSELNSLSLLTRLHDIGKIMISEDILKKPGKLNDEEWKEIKAHPEIGGNIVAATEEFSHIEEEIRHHHEHWNGEGYPDGLTGQEIPLLSRIISIVDAYDVITNERAYKEASSKEEAIKELKRCAGEQFDPDLVGKFIEVIKANDDIV